MKFLIVALFLTAFALCNCQTPKRPSISLFFDARLNIEVHVKSDNMTIRGTGYWAIDQPKGMGVENFLFHNRSHRHDVQDVFRLERYDLGYSYSMDNTTFCNKTKLSGNMPVDFAWVAQATYSGQRKFRDRTFDVWQFDTGYAKVELLVDDADVNTPVFLSRDYQDYVVLTEFARYRAVHPDATMFKVPDACNKAFINKFYSAEEEEVGCVSRSTMISRAQSWVDAHVPYNQGGTYGGYREDCSGFVSMAWEAAKPGYTTFTLHEIAHPISRSELQPGDVLLCASEHVVIFGGWVDSSSYTAYEETKPGEGTVKRTTPYPYWYNTACFVPYRYNSVC